MKKYHEFKLAIKSKEDFENLDSRLQAMLSKMLGSVAYELKGGEWGHLDRLPVFLDRYYWDRSCNDTMIIRVYVIIPIEYIDAEISHMIVR